MPCLPRTHAMPPFVQKLSISTFFVLQYWSLKSISSLSPRPDFYGLGLIINSVAVLTLDYYSLLNQIQPTVLSSRPGLDSN